MKKLSFFKSKEIKSNLIANNGGCFQTETTCEAQCGETIWDGLKTDHIPK
ncbi:MAG: hypothetical protein L3J23_08805 [Flavobacteriaceae bacterium]|nr:hypothetical protein [Flavobacteriaceae bacterium]